MSYYIKLRDKAFGPFNEEKLAQMIAAGKVSYETEVSTDKRYWQPLYQYPELAGAVPQEVQYNDSSFPDNYDQAPPDNYSQSGDSSSYFSSGSEDYVADSGAVSNRYNSNSQYAGQNRKNASVALISLFVLVLILFGIVIYQGVQIHNISSNPYASASSGEAIIKRLATESTKSVVQIKVNGAHGSGVVIAHDDNGALVLTSRHVIEEEIKEEVKVKDSKETKTITKIKKVISKNVTVIIAKDVQMLDGVEKTATVVATPTSDKIDLALVYVGDQDHQLSTQWKIASLQDVGQGDNVYAIGHPVDYPFTITSGICSAKRNNRTHWEVQHTAPINPGNSGGPLLNSKGEIVGINTYIRVQPIPLDTKISILQELENNLMDEDMPIRRTLFAATVEMILLVDYAHNLPRYNNLFFAMPADFIFYESEWKFLDKELLTKKMLKSIPNPKKSKTDATK